MEKYKEIIDKLDQLIEKHQLSEYKKDIHSLSKETILINSSLEEDYSELGNTRFGGVPDLAFGIEWPKSKYQDVLLTFLCQINLSDIKLEKSVLPTEGILYYFLGDIDDSEDIENKVLFYDGDLSNLKKHPEMNRENFFEDYYLETKPHKGEVIYSLTLPEDLLDIFFKYKISKNEMVIEKYNDLCIEYNNLIGKYTANLLGYYFGEEEIRNDSNNNTAVNLLELCSDSKVGFSFWDNGSTCFLIKEKALKTRNFNKVYCAIYSS